MGTGVKNKRGTYCKEVIIKDSDTLNNNGDGGDGARGCDVWNEEERVGDNESIEGDECKMANWRFEANCARKLTSVAFKQRICVLEHRLDVGGLSFAEFERLATEAWETEKIQIEQEQVRVREDKAAALREKQAKEAAERKEKERKAAAEREGSVNFSTGLPTPPPSRTSKDFDESSKYCLVGQPGLLASRSRELTLHFQVHLIALGRKSLWLYLYTARISFHRIGG